LIESRGRWKLAGGPLSIYTNSGKYFLIACNNNLNIDPILSWYIAHIASYLGEKGKVVYCVFLSQSAWMGALRHYEVGWGTMRLDGAL